MTQINLAQQIKPDSIDFSNFISKAKEYSDRTQQLHIELNEEAIRAAKKNHASSGIFERAKFCLFEALDLDEKGLEEDAVELYAKAVELCLTAQKSTNDEKLKKNLNKIAKQALERAEHIKNREHSPPAAAATAAPTANKTKGTFESLYKNYYIY